MKIEKLTYILLFHLVFFLGNIGYAFNSGFDLKSNPDILYLQEKQDSVVYKIYQSADSLYKAKSYQLALTKSYEVLDHPDTSKDRLLIADSYYLIGKIWGKTKTINSYEKAVTNYKKSLAVLTEILSGESSQGFADGITTSFSEYKYLVNYSKIANSYQKLYQRLLAKKQNKNETYERVDSLNMAKYRDSALFFYNKTLESNSLSTKILKLQAATYTNLSGAYSYEKDYNKAEEYAIQAIELKKKFADPYSLALAYSALGNVYFTKEEWEEAKRTYFEAEKIVEKSKGERIQRIRATVYQNVAYCMYHLRDYEAYRYLKDSWNIRSAIDKTERERELAAIEAERNYEKGLQEGIFQEEIKRRTAQRNSWIIGVSSFFVIVLLIFILKQYKLRQKNLGLELSKQELMQQQKLEKLKNESQIRILNATLDGKESERKQIAETLHDSVSALLSSANLHLQACKTQFNGSTPEEVDKSQTIINEASQKIRDLSHTLVSSILLKFGLSYAIKDISEKFSNSELKIDFETKYIKRYDQGFEIKLYNIIQEFINNILKHSKASESKITLVEKKKRLYLTIEDNGQGFDKTKITEKDGLGINQIDARIQMMQGKFHIESGKGKGTVIMIELPVFEKQLEAIS